MREHICIMAKSTEMAQIIALPFGGSRKTSDTEFQQVVGHYSTVGVEAAAMQDQSKHGNDHNINGLVIAEQQQVAARSCARITQRPLSLNVEASAASSQNAGPRRFGVASSDSHTTISDPEETQSLFALTETGRGLTSPSSIDYVSPLQLWLYQISNNMPMAERLEKSKWEVRRLERL